MCCCSGDAPNEPPLPTLRCMTRRPPSAIDRHGDPGADRRAVGLHADQLERDPVVAVAGVLEQPQRVRVAGRGAADLEDDFLVAVVVEIGKRDAVALVQLAGAGRRGHVDERLRRPLLRSSRLGTSEAYDGLPVPR